MLYRSRLKFDTFTVNAADTTGAIVQMGTSASPIDCSTTADMNANQIYVTSSAATGTFRGLYLRAYMTGGAGGEALRVFTTVSNAAPADTVNGAHISLSFGASAGNVIGQSAAIHGTYHLGNRTMTGTNSALLLDLYSDGSSSVCTHFAYIRVTNLGNSTAVAALLTTAYFAEFDASVCSDTDGMVDTNRTANTASGCIRILVNGTARWITYGTGS